ncbi:MAG: hypothetical protein VXW60_05760, partial [Bacteroidota bacterium]|nr:hypothetical protein [Bacteroidota bacterium]
VHVIAMHMPMATPCARAQGPTMHMRMDMTCTEQSYDRGAPNHPGKPSPPLTGNAQLPIWKKHISKRGFPDRVKDLLISYSTEPSSA